MANYFLDFHYEEGDTVIVNTAHLPRGTLFFHPRDGSKGLNLADDMRAASGRIATITSAKPLRFGYMYRIDIQPGFFYTNEFLIPGTNLTNSKVSSLLKPHPH